MKRRDLACFLIGSGVGLTLGVFLFLYSFIWIHHMFIFGFTSYIAPVLAALLPFGMVASGAALLMKERRVR